MIYGLPLMRLLCLTDWLTMYLVRMVCLSSIALNVARECCAVHLDVQLAPFLGIIYENTRKKQTQIERVRCSNLTFGNYSQFKVKQYKLNESIDVPH